MPEKIPDFSIERDAAETMGRDTAEGLIARTHESLVNGFFDKSEREEAERMLRTAELLSHDPEVKKEIQSLLSEIENIYGKK
jgi:hypothetical protein